MLLAAEAWGQMPDVIEERASLLWMHRFAIFRAERNESQQGQQSSPNHSVKRLI